MIKQIQVAANCDSIGPRGVRCALLKDHQGDHAFLQFTWTDSTNQVNKEKSESKTDGV